MNLKACCGLLASREDEDHDYDDVDHKILPKPRAAAERGRKVGVLGDTDRRLIMYDRQM